MAAALSSVSSFRHAARSSSHHGAAKCSSLCRRRSPHLAWGAPLMRGGQALQLLSEAKMKLAGGCWWVQEEGWEQHWGCCGL